MKNLYANEDYEPWAIKRDNHIAQTLLNLQCNFRLFQDQVIFAKDQILTKSNKPYTVYSP